MPNYVQLISKETGEATSFNAIDEELCNHFGYDIDPEKYFAGWYDSICGRLACGMSFDEIRERFVEHGKEYDGKNKRLYDMLINILEYLKEHYDSSAWASRG